MEHKLVDLAPYSTGTQVRTMVRFTRRELLVTLREYHMRVNILFDDHLTHASAHTESLWLTRWAREG